MSSDFRLCVSCGRTVDSGLRLCPYCGHDSQEYVQSALTPHEEPIPREVRILLYILSFSIWIAGVVVGLIYRLNPGPEHKRVGKNCLILAVVGIVLWAGLAALMYVMVLNFGSTSTGTPTATFSASAIPDGKQINVVTITKTDVPWSAVTIWLTDGINYVQWKPNAEDLDDGVAVTQNYGTEALASLTVRCEVSDVRGNGYVGSGDYMHLIAMDGTSFSSTTVYTLFLEYEPTGENIGYGQMFTA